MKFNNSEVEKRVRNYSDEELIEMIVSKSDQYEESAIEIALRVAEERGGIQNIKSELKQKKDKEEVEIKRKQKEEMAKAKMAAQEQLQIKQVKERAQLGDERPSNYKSSYKTTRIVAQIVANIGFITTVISCIVLLVTIISASQSRYGFQWIGLLPAFGGIISGLFLAMSGQLTRAIVDSSDNTGEILALLKRELKK